jgi:hypothetical protein
VAFLAHYTRSMETHRKLAERLTAMLGESACVDTRHMWQVLVGPHTVNVVLDLPEPLTQTRVWIFDPRRSSVESVRSFTVRNDQEFDKVLKQVADIPHSPPIPAR